MSIRIVPYGSKAYHLSIVLRDRILRKPLGLVFSVEDLAKEIHDEHLAYFMDEELVGCMVLTKTGQHSIKMRQVAVESDQQGRGIGSELLKFAEDHAKAAGFTEIYCHARDLAVPFYLKHGYKKNGDPFEEVTIVHYKMSKKL